MTVVEFDKAMREESARLLDAHDAEAAKSDLASKGVTADGTPDAVLMEYGRLLKVNRTLENLVRSDLSAPATAMPSYRKKTPPVPPSGAPSIDLNPMSIRPAASSPNDGPADYRSLNAGIHD